MKKNYKLDEETVKKTLEQLNGLTKDKGEVWKYTNYGYFISSKGRLFNEIQNRGKAKKKLETLDTSTEDPRYSFSAGGKNKKIELSRLMACYFGNGSPEMLFNLDFECHHLNLIHSDNAVSNLLMLHKKYHRLKDGIHSDLSNGIITFEDINTADKVYAYILRKEEPKGILNDINFDICDNVWIDRTEIYPDDEYKEFVAWCMAEGYNEQLLSSTIVYALVSDKAS